MLWTIIKDEIRFLTFRRMSPAVREHRHAYFVFGLFFTWLAGVGRYWDHPSAHLWQQLGLGSLAYVFVLAAVIWVLIRPLRPDNWSYGNILLFITLTAPPAVLYAIPVEKFLPLAAAQTANAWFLAVVAAWRVALYFVFLGRVGHLSGGAQIIAALSPLVFIVLVLVSLNLEHAVFEFMAGISDRPTPTSHDEAYGVVVLLSLLSILTAPFLLIGYIATLINRRRRPRRKNDTE